MYTISDIAKIVSGNMVCTQDANARVEYLLTDSRRLIFPDLTLFFALPGLHRSGNSFIGALMQQTVCNFVVDETFSLNELPSTAANIIKVKDVLQALQQLAAHHRQQFRYPVIGITGSNGKTVVKEWLYQLLNPSFQIIRSPRSYNSQVGVPLSVWQMGPTHELAIFEAGISQAGEMQHLQEIIQPSIGIFTNIGEAHQLGFADRAEKIKEKLKLFSNASIIVYCADQLDVHTAVQALYPSIDALTWSRNGSGVLNINAVSTEGNNSSIRASYKSEDIGMVIPFTDEASIENAIHVWVIMLYLGIPYLVIEERIRHLKPVAMRLELKQGNHACSVINDSYSTDITSLSIALDFLQQQQQHPKRTVILSDIPQSGKPSLQLYQEVASILLQKKVDRIIGVGNEITTYAACFSGIKEKSFFSTTSELRQQFSGIPFYNETVLLKGARVFEFEQISHLLEQKLHQTVLEINLHAISHNLKVYQQALQPGVKLMAMVKAFSYGSGSFEIANLLQFLKVDYLAVAYADEGVELRKAGIHLPIMVMNTEPQSFDLLVQYQLEPELYSFSILQLFENYLREMGLQHFPVHIKLDTGMRRLGFEMNDINSLATILSNQVYFKVQSVFSHLVASDNASQDAFTLLQAEYFKNACSVFKQALKYPFLQHIANTSAVHRHPDLQFNMVRLGIGLYGVDSAVHFQAKLKNVSTLKTTIAQIKKVTAGDTVGYNRAGKVNTDTTIATVRIGYADGYPRNQGNGKGAMLVKGHFAPVMGAVCMDMTMLNITGIDAKEGDEVIVFGADLPVTDLAEKAGTIPYEILTGISQRVNRMYYEE